MNNNFLTRYDKKVKMKKTRRDVAVAETKKVTEKQPKNEKWKISNIKNENKIFKLVYLMSFQFFVNLFWLLQKKQRSFLWNFWRNFVVPNWFCKNLSVKLQMDFFSEAMIIHIHFPFSASRTRSFVQCRLRYLSSKYVLEKFQWKDF